MTIKVGINGFGRIGRQVLKIIHQRYQGQLEIVAINSLRSPNALAYLLKYDSTYGRYNAVVESTEDHILVDGKPIRILAGSEPSQIPWADSGTEIVIEATGRFRQATKYSGHLEHGAKKVIITAPSAGVDVTIVPGVNQDRYDPSVHNIISGASCTTSCVAPVAKVLHDDFGIRRGFLSTIHAYTTSQPVLDRWQENPRRARAAAMNIIPTTTGASRVLAEVIPELKGKIDGIAFRVPIPTVSLLDFVADVEREEITPEEVNHSFRVAAADSLKGILEVCDEELVSTDFIGTTASATVDAPSTLVVGSNMTKVLAWYDNEWGYSCRIADLVAYVAERGL